MSVGVPRAVQRIQQEMRAAGCAPVIAERTDIGDARTELNSEQGELTFFRGARSSRRVAIARVNDCIW